MKRFATFALLLFASPVVAQDTLMERLALIEDNNRGILAMMTRQKEDIAQLRNDVAELKQMVEALGGNRLQVKSDWAGDRTFKSSTPTVSMQSYSYSAPMMSAPRQGIFGGRLFGRLRGGCANGS